MSNAYDLNGNITTAPKRFGLLCDRIHPRYAGYVVATSHREIIKCLSNLDKDTAKPLFVKTHKTISQYSDAELNSMYESQCDKWQDWCNDVLLFLCARKVLFGNHIPICDLDKLQC